MEEREREGGGDGAGSSSSAGASAALLLVMVVVVMQEEGDEEQKGERGIEKERLRGSGEIVRATAKRNASPVPIYMRQSINRACVAPTQSYPFVVRRRLRGLLARISPLGVPASAQGVD